MRARFLVMRRLPPAVAALLLWSCGGGDGTGPEGPDPNAVANVAVTPGTGTVDVDATLQLQALVTNAQGAQLTVSVSWTSSATSVATVNGQGLVTGVAQGTATITASAGGKSGNATITVNDPRPPEAPSNVVATPVSDTEIDVTWQDNSDNETGFTIEREAVAALRSPGMPVAAPARVFSTAGTVGPNVTTFRDSGLTPGASYRYRVSATNGNGTVAAEGSTTTTTDETLELLTQELAMGTVNVAYAQALEADGGNGSFEWSQTAGTMPPGLALQTTGSIEGTPTEAGAFDLTLEVTSGGQSVSMQYTLTINEEILPPEVVTTELPDGSVGNEYSADLEARLGDGTYAWALTDGSLPDGLSLSAGGEVSGVPTAAGTSVFTVEVTSAELTGSGEVSLTIRPPLTVSTTSLPTGVVGSAYAAQLDAEGGDGSYQWSALTDLPDGIVLATSGALSGTPTEAGLTPVTFQVMSGDGQSVEVDLDLTVFDVLTITTDALPDGQVGQAYSESVVATGGSGSQTWSLTAGSLPAGLTLSEAAGLIAGTPTEVGTSTFTVQAVSTDGQSASAELDIEVTAGPVTVTTTSLPDGQVGTAYNTTLAASGGDGASYAWTVSTGALPDGLALTEGTGVISGTPTTAGTFDFTVQATSGGMSGTQDLSITISALPPVVVTTTSLAGGTVGSPYSQTLTATGGDGTYTWSVTGSLPSGLTLNTANGVISGTPTAAGTSNFTVEATSAGLMGSKDLSITIVTGGGGAFNIELVYLSSISDTHKAAFESARSRWESIVTADLPDWLGGLPACSDFHPATAGDVDDLIIYVTVEPIDGEFGTLGQAGPCYTRNSSGLPITGAMKFDEADLDRLHTDGLLVTTILHEMGHVLGIGTLWDTMGFISGACTVDPVFTGALAIAAFDAAGGTGYGGPKVPIENTGSEGDGSNCGHWRESVFGTELMTPILNGGVMNPLSAITIYSLGDQGYSVNPGGADGYSLPGAPPRGAPLAPMGTPVDLGNDILPTPIYRVDASGRIELVRAGGR